MVEELVLIGLCAFIGIGAFYNYGRSLEADLHIEANLIEGKGLPDLDVVDWLYDQIAPGDMDFDGFDDVLSDLGGDGFDPGFGMPGGLGSPGASTFVHVAPASADL